MWPEWSRQCNVAIIDQSFLSRASFFFPSRFFLFSFFYWMIVFRNWRGIPEMILSYPCWWLSIFTPGFTFRFFYSFYRAAKIDGGLRFHGGVTAAVPLLKKIWYHFLIVSPLYSAWYCVLCIIHRAASVKKIRKGDPMLGYIPFWFPGGRRGLLSQQLLRGKEKGITLFPPFLSGRNVFSLCLFYLFLFGSGCYC